MGRRSKGKGIYLYIELIQFSVQQKLHNIVKQLYSNKNSEHVI